MRAFAVTYQKTDLSGRLPFKLRQTGQYAIFSTSEEAHSAIADILNQITDINAHSRKTIKVTPIDLFDIKPPQQVKEFTQDELDAIYSYTCELCAGTGKNLGTFCRGCAGRGKIG